MFHAKLTPRFNANTLKLIAVTAMGIQHTVALLMPAGGLLYTVLYETGRITGPIMCFFVAEGYYCTSDVKKYALRLLLCAILSHVPYCISFGTPVWNFWRNTSMLWSLFLGLIALITYHEQTISPVRKGLLIAGCCILAYPGNYNCVAVLWILIFGVLRDKQTQMWSAFFAVTFLHVAESLVVETTGQPWMRLNALAAVPLLLLYNGQLGKKSRAFKWGFYLFYPGHFLLLYALQRIL